MDRLQLTKTTKRTRERKAQLIENVKQALDQYPFFYIFSVQDLRTNHFKTLRAEWNDSRFFFGKSRVMKLAIISKIKNMLALESDENLSTIKSAMNNIEKDTTLMAQQKQAKLDTILAQFTPLLNAALEKITKSQVENHPLYKFSEYLQGQVVLLCSPRTLAEVTTFFDTFQVKDFARKDFKPDKEIILPSGLLEPSKFPYSMESSMRKWEIPVKVENGQLVLTRPYVVAEPLKPLSSAQAQMLKWLDIKLTSFKLTLFCIYSVKENALNTFFTLNQIKKFSNNTATLSEDDEETQQPKSSRPSTSNAFSARMARQSRRRAMMEAVASSSS